MINKKENLENRLKKIKDHLKYLDSLLFENNNLEYGNKLMNVRKYWFGKYIKLKKYYIRKYGNSE